MYYLSLLWMSGCGSVDCGEGTHLEGSSCVADSPEEETDSDTDTDTDGDSDSDTDADADGDTDADTDSDADVDTGPCAPTDAWTGAVPAPLFTLSPYDAGYDANLAEVGQQIGWGGSGTMGSPMIVMEATVVAARVDPRWEYRWDYWVADGAATLVVVTEGVAQVGDKVTFAFNKYSRYYDLPQMEEPGGWTVSSSNNPVAAPHVGAVSVDFSHYNELKYEAGELTGVSNVDCGNEFLCLIFEHDGVRDKIRLPASNSFGLDPDYNGGLCAQVVAPAGSSDVSGADVNFFDIADPSWMRVWPVP